MSAIVRMCANDHLLFAWVERKYHTNNCMPAVYIVGVRCKETWLDSAGTQDKIPGKAWSQGLSLNLKRPVPDISNRNSVPVHEYLSFQRPQFSHSNSRDES